MFHPFSKWKPLINCITKIEVASIKIHPWNADAAKGSYRKFSNQVCFPIVKFLSGQDFSDEPKQAFKAKANSMVDA